MSIVARWSSSGTTFKADAQKCYEEILEICEDIDSAPVEKILEKARDETTELHKCFTWDDTEAAERWRKYEAGLVSRQLVLKRVEEDAPKDQPEIRLFYSTDNRSGYKPTQIIVKKQDEYQALLNMAKKELQAFKKKYATLKNDLLEVFEAIDQL